MKRRDKSLALRETEGGRGVGVGRATEVLEKKFKMGRGGGGAAE